MEDTTAHLVNCVLPDVPMRQWVISPPFELRGLLASRGEVLSKMIRIFVDEVFKQMKAAAKDLGIEKPQCGAVGHIQRFSKTLNIHPHGHINVLDGVYIKDGDDEPVFHPLSPP